MDRRSFIATASVAPLAAVPGKASISEMDAVRELLDRIVELHDSVGDAPQHYEYCAARSEFMNPVFAAAESLKGRLS